MEKRAVRISHELWRQIITQCYTSGGWHCVKGLPEDAELVGVWVWEGRYLDPVFVFESDSWEAPAEREIGYGENVYPEFLPEFRVAECRTCYWWKRWSEGYAHGKCFMFESPKGEMTISHTSPVITDAGFGCTGYKYQEATE